MLLGLRAPADGAEHLRPLQRELHGTPDLARRHRREEDVRPDRALAAEAAADVRIDHSHILGGNSERLGDHFTRASDVLRRVVESELAALPMRDRPVRLHRVVVLHRRLVDGVHLHFGLGERLHPVAPLLRRRTSRHLRRARVCLCLFEIDPGLGILVAHPQLRGGIVRLLQRLGHDDRDRLAVVANARVLEERKLASGRRFHRRAAFLRKRRRVLVSEDQEHARNQ